MSIIFLILAVIGTVVPYVFFVDHFAVSGVSLTAFAQALFANGAAGGFTADLLVSSLVFWLFLWMEKARYGWAFVLLNLTIGLSCAFPLYLYFRSRLSS